MNVFGGFQCGNCSNGWITQGSTGCLGLLSVDCFHLQRLDIDECASGLRSCPASSSKCLNVPGAWLCSPGFVDGSLRLFGGQPTTNLTLTQVRGGQILQFLLATSGANATATSAFLRSDKLPALRFPCRVFSTAAAGAGQVMVTCTLSPSAGANLTFGVRFCDASQTACGELFGRDTVSFPAPVLKPRTLHLFGRPETQTAQLIVPTSFVTKIAFFGDNFMNDSRITIVRYGSSQDPLQYPCVLNDARTNTTTIVCDTADASSGIDMHFTVSVAGVSAVGNDSLTFPTIPKITSVSGCSSGALPAATYDCPTAGGVDLTVTGTDFEVICGCDVAYLPV